MRLSPLMIAVSLALMSGCQSAPPTEAQADVGSTSYIAPVLPGAPLPAPLQQPAPADALESVAANAAAGQAAKQSLAEQQRANLQVRRAPATVGALAMAPPPAPPAVGYLAMPQANTEHYAAFEDSPLHLAAEQPVSTFSIDVDTGSYSNVRRMLMAGQRPPADAVRAEEMINYFDYGYAAPTARDQPFRVTTELAPAPWNRAHRLLQVGIQGYRVPTASIPASNLVLLIDTSGSMQDPDKLPLLKRSFAELVARLRAQDRVSIVVYAGSAGLVLAPTPGDRKDLILAALDRLEAGGSTNGGEGLQLAYAQARAAFIRNGVNRVLLATDGDFNVGTFDQRALETMVADQRKTGVALTTLGFGTGNYNDAMAERLADLGNGNHAYVDSIEEARKVLGEEMSSTMLTIAEDVKIQVEFNPAVVAEYRLIGYENRALRREDFNNDRVDAGGASVDPLRYGKPAATGARSDELAWLRLRYKRPGESSSQLTQAPIKLAQAQGQASPALRWAAAVAAYADLLRGGRHLDGFGWAQVRHLAEGARGSDPHGERAQFLDLVDRAAKLTTPAAPVAVTE